MKKLIAILLASSLGLAAPAYAKPDDAKKKSKAAPQHAPQQTHVNAAPKTKLKVHQNTPNYHSANVNPAKIQKKEFHQQQKELRKTNVVRPNNVVTTNPNSLKKHQPNVQRNELPAVQKNQKTVVNTQPNHANIQVNRAKYKDFKAQRNTSIASAQFNQNYRIQNSQNWTGPQYRAFHNYRPQWHDHSWWRSSPFAASIVLIGGGYYYWNSGYWYPAWGYDSAYSYYPYDGPIYVGDNRVPFDRVLATVQATLQEQGYYRGEVDGLMGPLTREALANYQRDHGLISTAALDQPTLASLGLG